VTIGGYEPDVGPYFDGGYDFQAFELATVTHLTGPWETFER